MASPPLPFPLPPLLPPLPFLPFFPFLSFPPGSDLWLFFSFFLCVSAGGQSLERGRARTYGELLFSMRDTISRALKGGHLDMGSLATVGLAALMGGPAMAAMVAAPMALSGFTGGVQTPQLSASECFNLNTPFSL